METTFGYVWNVLEDWKLETTILLGLKILDSSSEAGIAETQNAPATASTCNDGLGCSKTPLTVADLALFLHEAWRVEEGLNDDSKAGFHASQLK